MKYKILLLYANSWQMKDDDGKLIDGVSCNYYFNTSLAAVGNSDGSVGQRPAKCSLPMDLFFKIKTAPAIYEAEFEMRVGGDGKPVLTIADLDFVEEVMVVPESERAAGAASGKKVG